jgi:hypothetical protein
MSESSSFAGSPVEIPGTVVAEVPHTSLDRVPAHPMSGPPAAPATAFDGGFPVPQPTQPPVAEPQPTPQPEPTPEVAPEAPKDADADADKDAEKKEPKARTRGMASGGAPVGDLPVAPEPPVWPDFAKHPDATYVPDEEFDATDLMQVNRELNRARARVFRCSDILKMCQRTLAEAQSNYDRQMRRALVTVSGGTAESRKALAEIQCEEFENRVIVGKQVVEEWRRRCGDARDDLKALENISHNVRASLDIR